MTFVTPVGRFVFLKTTPLSQAKLIRDSVVGELFIPKSGVKLRNSQDIYSFVKERLGHILGGIWFEYSVV